MAEAKRVGAAPCRPTGGEAVRWEGGGLLSPGTKSRQEGSVSSGYPNHEKFLHCTDKCKSSEGKRCGKMGLRLRISPSMGR